MQKKTLLIFVIILIIIVGIVAIGVLGKKKKEESNQNNLAEGYSLKYKGIDITPGKAFKESDISEKYDYSEIESCAFEGKDKIYTYSDVEVNVAKVDGKDTVYSVYFLNTEPETGEGIKISDSKEQMIKAYGENYENITETNYIYKKGNVNLSFIVENDIITSIEYTLEVK